MPNFQNPLALLFLLCIPLLYFFRKIKIFKKISLPIIVGDWDGSMFDWEQGGRKFVFYAARFLGVLAFSLVVVALAKPVVYYQKKIYTSKGTDIFFVLDVSPSMSAKDMGGISRFDSARSMIKNLVQENDGTSYGLIAVASDAAVIVPPTTAYDIFFSRLASLTIGSLGDNSAFGTGISSAVYHLSTSSAPKKCIILVTDGENNAGAVHPETAAELASKNGIVIYTIGIGTRGTVPLDYVDPNTGKVYSGYLQSNFDSVMLKKLASISNGKYYEAQTVGELASALSVIARNTDVAQSYYMQTTSKEYYRSALIAAIVLFALLWVVQRSYLQEYL